MEDKASINLIRDRLVYNPRTGIFRWKIDIGKRCKAGDRAGYIRKMKSTPANLHRRFITIRGQLYSASRLAFVLVYGRWPVGQVDHINHTALDDRLINLREVTVQNNLKNRGIFKRNKSGVTGVHFSKRAGKWEASIGVDNKLLYLGYFTDFETAVKTRREAEVRYGFHPNHGK